MNRTLSTATLVSLGVAVGLLLAQATHADPPAPKPKVGGKAHKLYAEGYALAKKGNWGEAHATFVKAHAIEKQDPDVLTMLAFTTRKHTKDTRKAIALYHEALSRRASFPQARAYLAEAHVAAALAEYDALRKMGKAGEKHAADVAAAIEFAAASFKDQKREPLPMKRGW